MRFIFIKHVLFSPNLNSFRTITSNVPRVRFAPSPTGYLHLGGLRTALYNYLFAKNSGGVFILRIEDTDQTRKVAGSVESLISDLNWAGIEYDEGPGSGGKFGPYVQSQRLHIYKEQISKLLENGSAYKCFCTERRLNMIRREAMKSQQIPKYDNRCRNLSHEDINEKMRTGVPYCIRFKLTPDIKFFDDLIFGGIAYDVTLNEGDPVLVKSDGYPTYHFANVVDDHLMGVSHVLRGVEWQISTTKHLLIYKAFGWRPPRFGHLPLIVNADGTKLSKRQSDVKVEDYRNKGVFPLALVNYITMAGGGFEHTPGAGVRLETIEELSSEFQLANISCHPSRLSPALLEECNRLEIRRRLADRRLAADLVHTLQGLIEERFPGHERNTSDDHVRNVLNWATSRITRIEDLTSNKYGFFWVLPSHQTNLDKELLTKLLSNLENVEEFEEKKLKEHLRTFSKENGVKFPVLMKMLRSILSGLEEGPSVAEMMDLLGKNLTLQRIKAVLI